MKSFPNRLTLIASRIIIVIGIFISSILTYCSFRYSAVFYANKVITYKNSIAKYTVLFVISFALIFTACHLLSHVHIKKDWFIPLIISILAFVFELIFCYQSNTYVVGDQAHIFLAAQTLYSHSANWITQDLQYFSSFPWQITLVYILSFFMKLTNNDSIFVIQCFQAFFCSSSIFAVYIITKKITQSPCAVLSSLLLSLFMPLHLVSSFVYWDSISIGCLIWGIAFYYVARMSFQKRIKIICFPAATFLILASCSIKMVNIIIVIALLIIEILIALREKVFFYCLFPIICGILVFASLKFFPILAFSANGLDSPNSTPGILNIAMGMQWEHNTFDLPGSYNGYNVVTMEAANYDAQLATNMAKEKIKERIDYFYKNPAYTYEFYKLKTLEQWAHSDYSLFYCTSYHDVSKAWIDKLYQNYYDSKAYDFLVLFQFTSYFFTILYFLFLWRMTDNSSALPNLVLGLFVIGGFLSSLLLETCSRYTLTYAIIISICSMIGIINLYNYSMSKLSKPSRC